MAYSTRIRLKKLKSGKSKKIYSSKTWQQERKNVLKRVWHKIHLGRFKKAFFFTLGVFLIIAFIGGIYLFAKIQELSEKLPSIDKPFGAQPVATEIYDRNGNLLYRVYSNDDRDNVTIKDVPFLVKEAFLAAEDEDFYSHPGIDVTGLIRCGVRIVGSGGESECGASTIDQQLIKLTSLGQMGMDKYSRKISEWIMALQMEKKYSKSQILEMYLTIVPEGSNVYGITRGAKVYFNKELKDLTLAEIAVLAAIPYNPNGISPRTAGGAERVKDRQSYVLDQMQKYIDAINTRYKQETGSQDNVLTKEMIDAAKAEVVAYQNFSDKDKIKAPHFVFYVEKLLQERGYNNGVPFTKEELETSGLKIYTTLDMDYQAIAEEQVKLGVDKYGAMFNGHNAALMALNPKNGEILAMVGSYDYWGANYPAGCSGSGCQFSGQVNILDTLQSYGSSMKPFFYYMALERGIVNAGSIIGDVPIQIGNYRPKNYEGGFDGIKTVREALAASRNIPAIELVNYMGIDNVIPQLQKFGYTTFQNAQNFGPAIAVGGGDVKLIEHAQAYQILATEGYYQPVEVVTKIVNAKGETIYEYNPQPQLIADPKGTFIINDILNAKKGGPGVASKLGRDVGGKTGSTENAKDTLFVAYTPEIVIAGWLGNNDNTPMKSNTNGNNSARPWISGFYTRIEPKLKGESFTRPAGITTAANCVAEDGASCDGAGGADLAIAGISAPVYLHVKPVVVCIDQPTKLARPVDIAMGKSVTVSAKVFSRIDQRYQQQMDDFLKTWMVGKLAKDPAFKWAPLEPTEYCDINRNPNGDTNPWVQITVPAMGDTVTGNSLNVNASGYSVQGTVSGMQLSVGGINKSYTTSTINEAIDISSLGEGEHLLTITVSDSTGLTATKNVTFIKMAPTRTPAPTTVIPTATVAPTSGVSPTLSGNIKH